MKNLAFIKALFSPFKPFKIQIYFGEIQRGVPYNLPGTFGKKHGEWKPKKFGIDTCSLGWKTKWGSYRYEYDPMLSIVIFGKQLHFTILAEYPHQYWESWLYYEYNTSHKLSKKERIAICKKEAGQIWSHYENGEKVYIDYYDLILKDGYIERPKTRRIC